MNNLKHTHTHNMQTNIHTNERTNEWMKKTNEGKK